jgi:predicted aspartyl protease
LYASPTAHDHAGRILAPVKVNGQGPFKFVVDTGATLSVLSPHVAAKLGLTPNADSSVLLSGVTGSAIVGTVHVQSLEVGDLVMRDLTLPVIGATMNGVDGILGVEGFEDLRLTVDFVHDRIKIERSQGQRAPRGYYTLSARIRHGRLLVVDAAVGQIPVQAVIDTGADGTLGTEKLRQLLQRKVFGARADKATIEGVTSDIQYGDMINAPTIRLQSVEIEKIRIAYGDFRVFELWGLQHQPALLVGMDVLGTVEELIIDYKRREVQLKARPDSWY